LILQELGARLAQRRADGQSLALLYVQCGVVGRVDEVWGHAVGDAVRARFAAMLRAEVLRPGDLLGELGRDELACVLETVQSAGIALLAAEKVLRALDEPVLVGEDEVFASPAIGIAVFPEHGDTELALLQHARAACRATHEGPERIAVFTRSLEPRGAEALRAESRLRGAIAQNALALAYRPRTEFRTGLLAGAECALRWADGERELVPTRDAMQVARAAGLAGPLVEWMLNGALRDCAEFRQSAGLDLRVGVGLPATALRDPDVADVVARALGTWGLRAGRLLLQVGETAVFQASLAANDTLKRLKGLGVRLAIDDPGAGFGSLAYLSALPFDQLKIDAACVRDMLGVPQHLSIVRSLIELGHQLRLEVIADGVEDGALADRLKALGCDYMQGGHVGPALDAAEFVRSRGAQ